MFCEKKTREIFDLAGPEIAATQYLIFSSLRHHQIRQLVGRSTLSPGPALQPIGLRNISFPGATPEWPSTLPGFLVNLSASEFVDMHAPPLSLQISQHSPCGVIGVKL